jgi:hypothetical protein
MRRSIVLPTLTAFALLLGGLAYAPRAHADTGYLTAQAGAMGLTQGEGMTFSPYARADVGLRLWGPFTLGGFFQASSADLMERDAGLGGGLVFAIRPDVSLLGFVPHAEVSGARLQLPGASRNLDAWALNVAGSLGYEIGAGLSIEARVQHSWYFDLPQESGVGQTGWTFGGGLSYRIP